VFPEAVLQKDKLEELFVGGTSFKSVLSKRSLWFPWAFKANSRIITFKRILLRAINIPIITCNKNTPLSPTRVRVSIVRTP